MPVVYRKHPQIAARVVDETAFVVTADNNVLHTLNESGTTLWRLTSKPFTLDDAMQALVSTYEVSQEQALQDAEECLALFVQKGLLITEET